MSPLFVYLPPSETIYNPAQFISSNMPGRTRPIEKFAAAAAKCTTEGAVYGKCVSANYQNVSKDMCVKEFMMLKDCYVVSRCYSKR